MGISVLMSVYKKEKPEYLDEALDSIIHQTMMPDEIVLIEDGPLTDELYKVINQKKEEYSKLRTYVFEENVQLGRALAKGVTLCENDLIARMDTDDIAMPNRLEIQYEYMMKYQDVAVVGGNLQEFSDDVIVGKIKVMPTDEQSFIKYARYRNPLNHMTVMFRKDKVLAAGNYQHYPLLEDYHLWIRMLGQRMKLSNIPKVLVNMRISDSMYKRRGGRKYFMRYKDLRKLERELGLLSVIEYPISILLSFLMTMQTSGMRRWIYQHLLRK